MTARQAFAFLRRGGYDMYAREHCSAGGRYNGSRQGHKRTPGRWVSVGARGRQVLYEQPPLGRRRSEGCKQNNTHDVSVRSVFEDTPRVACAAPQRDPNVVCPNQEQSRASTYPPDRAIRCSTVTWSSRKRSILPRSRSSAEKSVSSGCPSALSIMGTATVCRYKGVSDSMDVSVCGVHNEQRQRGNDSGRGGKACGMCGVGFD